MPSPCENVQDRFSSFWEKALSPSEETEVNRHLDACPSCREAYRRFEHTLRMLHSMDEVEAPDGLLEGINEKLEERKRTPREAPSISVRPPSSWKLPAQAIAMVTLVFLALYLTQNRPADLSQKRESVSSESSLSSGEKTPQAEENLPTKGGLKAASRTADSRPDQKEVSAPEARIPKAAKESIVKEAEPSDPPEKTDAVPAPPPAPAPLLERQASGQVLADRVEKKAEERSPREVTITTKDPEGISAQIQDLVKRFGGEIHSSERKVVLAAVPGSALTVFCEELARIGRPPEKPETSAHRKSSVVREDDAIRERSETKRKGKPPSMGAAREGESVLIRIMIQPIPPEN